MVKDQQKLLAVRREIKRRKPTFIRSDAHWKVRVPEVWRRPRGLHNKMRRKMRSFPRSVCPGWRSPAQVRGLSSEGKKIVLIATLKELLAFDKSVVAEIRSSVGIKKRMVIMQEAKKRQIRIKNVKNIDTALEEMNKEFDVKKKSRALWQAQKAMQKSKEKAKEPEKKTIDATLDPKEAEKKEQEKTLNKRM